MSELQFVVRVGQGYALRSAQTYTRLSCKLYAVVQL